MSHHQYNLHRHRKYLKLKRDRSILDHFMYIVALSSIVMTLPQAYDIWVKRNNQVSLLTWSAFAVISLVWIIYALIHKDKQILFNSVGALIVDCLIVAGILLIK